MFRFICVLTLISTSAAGIWGEGKDMQAQGSISADSGQVMTEQSSKSNAKKASFAAKMKKVNEIFSPLILELWSLVFYLGPLATMVYAAKRTFEFLQPYFVTSKPNEWMIVLRNGQPTKIGVGIYSMTGPFDQVIKFPTHIRSI